MLKVTIENLAKIEANIWKAKLNPSEVRFLGSCSNSIGVFSIISLPKEKISISNENIISFSPENVKVLNIGLTNKLLILIEDEPSYFNNNKVSTTYSEGDMKFLENLPSELKNIGSSILIEVRKHFKGNLKYYETSGKFIESPDNFWTVKIQPRDKSLRITVRGIPSMFHPLSIIDVKPDMNGYSRFKIKNENEIEEAIRIILKARKK